MEIREEVPDFKIFTFEKMPHINYKAGQYLTFVHAAQDQEIRRSYSITSSPGIDEAIAIGVKRIPNGFFSRLLVDHAEVGDELVTIGAGGLFVLPGDLEKYKQLFFFAAGSGITPIYSIIRSALHAHSCPKVVLIYSTHAPSTTIFSDELQSLQKQFSGQLSIEWLFSNSPNLSGARLYRDSLIQFVKSYSISSLDASLFFICGPISYMRMCTFVLQEMEVPPENIKRENFLIAQPRPLHVLPPDQHPHFARITFGGNQYRVLVYYPDSILGAARKQGIVLPYSCETGRCASCLARCTKGTVWLSHNEVLTETELSKGFTLTCVGHPLGGDVDLQIEWNQFIFENAQSITLGDSPFIFINSAGNFSILFAETLFYESIFDFTFCIYPDLVLQQEK